MSDSVFLNWADRVGHWFGSTPKEGPDALPVRVHGREYGRTRVAPAGIKAFDQNLVWAIAGLLIWGLVMVYSASIALNDGPRSTGFSQVQYLVRHMAALGVGFIAALLVFQVSMDTWEKTAPWVFIVSIVLLIVVLLPFMGKSINGARR
jgi:cell division protein FtsW